MQPVEADDPNLPRDCRVSFMFFLGHCVEPQSCCVSGLPRVLRWQAVEVGDAQRLPPSCSSQPCSSLL